MLECLIEVSVGLSQFENFREYFSHDVKYKDGDSNDSRSNSSGKDSNGDGNNYGCQTSLCSCILQTIKLFPYLTSNGIAALLNACIESSSSSSTTTTTNHSVRTKIIELHGYDIITTNLFITDKQRMAVIDKNIFVRKSSLLAKLAGDNNIKQKLIEPTVYRDLCKRIAISTLSNSFSTSLTTITTHTANQGSNNNKQVESWMLEEQANYIRILANLTEHLNQSCLQIAFDENIIEGLLSILPQPKDECGEITANSVILMPNSLASPLLLGMFILMYL